MACSKSDGGRKKNVEEPVEKAVVRGRLWATLAEGPENH